MTQPLASVMLKFGNNSIYDTLNKLLSMFALSDKYYEVMKC